MVSSTMLFLNQPLQHRFIREMKAGLGLSSPPHQLSLLHYWASVPSASPAACSFPLIPISIPFLLPNFPMLRAVPVAVDIEWDGAFSLLMWKMREANLTQKKMTFIFSLSQIASVLKQLQYFFVLSNKMFPVSKMYRNV